MKGWAKALSLLASVSFTLIAEPALQLEGQLTQGSLLRGKVPVGSQVFFNDIELPLSATFELQRLSRQVCYWNYGYVLMN